MEHNIIFLIGIVFFLMDISIYVLLVVDVDFYCYSFFSTSMLIIRLSGTRIDRPDPFIPRFVSTFSIFLFLVFFSSLLDYSCYFKNIFNLQHLQL